jgi:DNA-binding response OmpR family regulator
LHDARPSLLVSRDDDVVDLYVLALRTARVGLISVGAVDEALQLVRDRSISAVIVDVADPNTDWDACGALRAAIPEDMPLIVLTGWIDAQARHQADAIGCAAFVAKPASPEQMLDVLRRVRTGERGIVVLD